MFDRYIGIDYSGAGTSNERSGKLAVQLAEGDGEPKRKCTYAQGAKNWTRAELAHWLARELRECPKTLVGIDHAFSFPIKYFRQHYMVPANDWEKFLDDFQNSWPTDQGRVTVREMYYKQIRRMMGQVPGEYRFGFPYWQRLTEKCATVTPAPVFDFMAGPRTVAFSSHAGLPWLRQVRQESGGPKAGVHFWPFDGWSVCGDHSVVVEVYPAIWKKTYKKETKHMNSDQRDAYMIARWMSERDHDENDPLAEYFHPRVPGKQKPRAKTEGWIFGVRFPSSLARQSLHLPTDAFS
ncbi:MAG: hypothetical protein F4W95_07970 [Chloroflexi bacterium]|nr:hypothetical protein [Chloroflexota bacterium]MYD48408.1 hypothetical protein [Chloroflexota bacterium]